ncbi:MAG: DUF6265 family protein [Bacteroidales bacterium]
MKHKISMTIKVTITIVGLFMTDLVIPQSSLPDFLEGTWKIENNEVYEHWDRLNESSMKGFSYIVKDGKMSISEYLEISQIDGEISYTATVLNQNEGKPINFKLTKTDSTYTFDNPDHDFPKKIVYQKLNNAEVFVQVSDGKQKGFAYKIIRQHEKETVSDTTVLNPNYDPRLAQKLGADDYGMKGFILVILKTGPNQTTDTKFINESFRGHLDNIGRLAEEGKLVVAGPLGSNKNNYRGIFILNAATTEEAEALLKTDPAIREGLLNAEIYNWYGSAALPVYLDYSDKIWKVKP